MVSLGSHAEPHGFAIGSVCNDIVPLGTLLGNHRFEGLSE